MLRKRIFDNVYFSSHKDENLKNNILNINFILPLNINTVSKYAVLPYLLTICNEEYSDIVKLNKKLNELYGANIWADVKKINKFQILSIGINFISEKYALDNKNITLDCCNLLFSIVKRPYLVDGMFEEKNIKIAKKILIDKIDDRLNNKTDYAIDKCLEYMFQDEEQKISKYGYKKDIMNISGKEIKEAYYEIFKKSKIQIVYVGNEEENVKEACKNLFNSLDNLKQKKLKLLSSDLKSEVCKIEKKMDLSQSILIVGFKCNSEISYKNSLDFIIMNMIFGGTAFSKLFINIREKMGLCYSCASQYDKFSNTIIVSVGLDHKNKEKATDEILRLLDEMKSGKFTSEELENAKSIAKNILLKSKNSVFEINNKCLSQYLFGISKSVIAETRNISRVSRDDVIRAANKVNLDTVYFLRGDDED